ncbi:MAG: DUF6516 family protein [bacterium]
MEIEDYFNHVEKIINNCPVVQNIQVFKQTKTEVSGVMKIRLYFIDGSELHSMEFIEIKEEPEKYKYRYHYQKDNKIIFRYDDAPHHHELINFPHHKHIGEEDKIEPVSKEPTLSSILKEIEEKIYNLKKIELHEI